MKKITRLPYVEVDGATFWPFIGDNDGKLKPFSDFAIFMQAHGYTVTPIIPPLELPTAPGTVIAIGEWWFVKLRPYRPGMEGAWEFLPVPSSVKPSLERSGQEDQCVYDNAWVSAEAEQNRDGFTVIAEPRA